MSDRVLFHNKVIRHPGAEVYVDLSGMVQPGVDETRVAGGIAEAPGGQPGVTHVFVESKTAHSVFGQSDASNLVKILMDPSKDTRVEGGADVVYIYKPNRTTQAEYWVVRDPEQSQVKALTFPTVQVSAAYAAKRDDTTDPITPAFVNISTPTFSFATGELNNLVAEVLGGTGKGQQRFIQASTDLTTSRAKLELRDDQDWDVLPDSTSTIRILTPQAKLTAIPWGTDGNDNEIEHGRQPLSQSYELQTKKSKRVQVAKTPYGGLRKTPFHVKFDPTGGGPLGTWNIPANWVIPQAVDNGAVEGTATGVATNTSLDGGSGMTTVPAALMPNRWLIVTEVSSLVPAQAPVLGKCFKILTNTATTISLMRPGLGLPSGTDLTGLKWKVFAITDVYMEIGGTDGAATSLKIQKRDGGGVTTIISLDLTLYPTLGDLEKKLDGIAGIFSTIGHGVSSGYLTKDLDFGILSDHYGQDRRSAIDTAVVTGDTTLSLEVSDDFPTTAGGVTYLIRIEPGDANEETVRVTGNDTGTDTLTVDPLVKAHAIDSVVEFVRGSQLIQGPGNTSLGFPVRDNLKSMLDLIANSIGHFTADRAVGPGSTGTTAVSAAWNTMIGSAQPEDNKDLFRRFSGGEVGTSIVQKPSVATLPGYPISWEHGMDTLLKNRDIRVEVLAASQDKPNWATDDIFTLHNLFKTHLLDCEDNKGERIGFMGMALPLRAGTFANKVFPKGLLDIVREANEPRLALTGQQLRRSNSGGETKLLDEWALAAAAAGTMMGTDLGEPITLKFVKGSELVQRYGDWDPQEPLDIKDALDGRLLYGEPHGKGWRFVRGFSTHVQDANLALTDLNVFEIRNYIRRRYRTKMEDRFGGVGSGNQRPGVRYVAPGGIASIREYMGDLLDEDRENGIIVDSLDENNEWTHAWYALSVKQTGDTVWIKVLVFPKTGINYILIDFDFQIPRLSA